jgi:hypothetical protein
MIALFSGSILPANPAGTAEPSFCYIGEVPKEATRPNAPVPWKYLEYATMLVVLRQACGHDTGKDETEILASVEAKGCSVTSEMYGHVRRFFAQLPSRDFPSESEAASIFRAIESARTEARDEYHAFCSFMSDFRYPEFNGQRWCELSRRLFPIMRRFDPDYPGEPPTCS